MQASDIWPGRPYPLGATFDGAGVNFAVTSFVATRVEVCLFDPVDPRRETARLRLPENTDGVWHGYVPGLGPGTLYGLRVHGPYEPERGHRCNPHKLLVDPYARVLLGETDWREPVFGYQLGHDLADLTTCDKDSAAGTPKSVVLEDTFDWGDDRRPDRSWRETVIYEAHVRGMTMRHPDIPGPLRGTYAGFAQPAIIDHLVSLGVTAVELLPVHEAADDSFLEEKGLRNYWGYSTLAFFAPEQRYAADRTPGGPVREMKTLVKALHAAGIEVILDVVYNHTAEGNHLGPTLSLKGIDNAAYYWLMPEARYNLDFTGCGNSLKLSSGPALRLVVDSLRYWATEMHVDGFRFDLATVMGRTGDGGFDANAAFFQVVNQDPVLSRLKLIAEPWDCGLGGYQVGAFPAPWREWNGKYRDTLRRFWRGDENLAGELGYRLAGSADLYRGRRPQASINFVTCHDGFTLHDLVTYGEKHNEANGEANRDGSDDNQSWNCGVEGETDDAEIVALRERQKRNLLASLMLSTGVPMLSHGDELGRTQRGNNNGYCQDSELTWIDWELDEPRRKLLAFTRRLVRFRAEQPVLARRRHFRGAHIWNSETKDLAWFRPDGTEMTPEDWERPFTRSVAFLLGGDAIPQLDERGRRVIGDALLVLMNAHDEAVDYKVPEGWGAEWHLVIDTTTPEAPKETVLRAGEVWALAARALAVFRQPVG
jgi:isoamylase